MAYNIYFWFQRYDWTSLMINGNKLKCTILNNIALMEWKGHRRNINRYTTDNFRDIKLILWSLAIFCII